MLTASYVKVAAANEDLADGILPAKVEEVKRELFRAERKQAKSRPDTPRHDELATFIALLRNDLAALQHEYDSRMAEQSMRNAIEMAQREEIAAQVREEQDIACVMAMLSTFD